MKRILLVGLMLTKGVCLGSTFGYTTVGGTLHVMAECRADPASSQSLTVTSNITIDSLAVYGTSGVDTASLSIAIYTRRNGAASSFVAKRKILFTTTPSWKAVACTISVNAPDTICLALGDEPTDGDCRLYYNNIAGAGSYHNSACADNCALPATWVHGASDRVMTVYAVYSAAAPPATSTPSRRRRLLGNQARQMDVYSKRERME